MRHTELNVLFASQAIQWVLFPPYLQHLELLLRHIIYVLSLYCSTATHKNDSITSFIHINIIGILLSVSHSPWDRNGQSNNTLLNLKGKVLLLGCWDLMQPLLPMVALHQQLTHLVLYLSGFGKVVVLISWRLCRGWIEDGVGDHLLCGNEEEVQTCMVNGIPLAELNKSTCVGFSSWCN